MGAWRRAGLLRRPVGIVLGLGLVAAVVGVAALVGTGQPAPSGRSPVPAGTSLEPPGPPGRPARWQRVEPGGRTLCGRGGRFAFWARMGAPDRLLVFFQGGGGCWNYRSCAPGTALFDDRVDVADDPSVIGAGVLDLADPRNPFRDWSVLYIPSCTGDVYAGDASRTYRATDGRAVTVHHRGHVNAVVALDWVFRRVPDPRRVFVTGCSAGSVGSILHAPAVIRQYPTAHVAQLGDSLGFLFSEPTDLRELWGADRQLPDWLPAVRAIPPARFTMPRFYDAVAGHHRQATFAQLNFRDDAVQHRYWEAGGGAPERFEAALLGNLAAMRAASPNFRSCLLEGSTHCALPREAFYTLRSGRITVRDWVAALAEGRPVPNLPPGP